MKYQFVADLPSPSVFLPEDCKNYWLFLVLLTVQHPN